MKLSDRERQVLVGMAKNGKDFFMPFKQIAKLSGVEIGVIRRTVRALARKGLTVYERCLWTDDGEMAGAGYGITDAGWLQLEETEGVPQP